MRAVLLSSALLGGLMWMMAPPAYCEPPEKLEVMPAPASTANVPACNVPRTISLPAQKICLEMSAPEIVIQQAYCPPPPPPPKPCSGGLLRCCHFGHRCCQPMMMPAMPVQSVPMSYAVAPAMSYAVAPAMSYGVAAPAMSYGVAAPAMSYGVAAPAMSYGVAAPAMSYGVAAPAMSYGVAPAPAMSYGVAPQATLSIGVAPSAPAVSYGVQPTMIPINLVPQAIAPQGTQPSAQGTAGAKDDINETLKKLNQNLQGLISVVDRHHDHIVDHEKRLKALEDRLDALGKWKEKNDKGGKTIP